MKPALVQSTPIPYWLHISFSASSFLSLRWWAVGCCPDYEFKLEEFKPERGRVKVSVIGWENTNRKKKTADDSRTLYPCPHTARATHGKNVTHNARNPHRKPSCFVSHDKMAHQEVDMYNIARRKKPTLHAHKLGIKANTVSLWKNYNRPACVKIKTAWQQWSRIYCRIYSTN